MLEIYHLAMLEWWRDRITWRGSQVPIVFATPDRAFSDMKSLISNARGNSGTALKRDQNAPLPFLSLSESGLEVYDGSRDNAGQIRGMYVNPELTIGVNVDWPTPVKLSYQLDFWCETLNQRRHFQDMIRRFFKLNTSYMEIDFMSSRWDSTLNSIPAETKMLGKRQVAINKLDWTDASNLDPGEGNRDIRISLPMTVDAWMARGYTEVPLVREVKTEVRFLEDGSLLSTFAVFPSN